MTGHPFRSEVDHMARSPRVVGMMFSFLVRVKRVVRVAVASKRARRSLGTMTWINSVMTFRTVRRSPA
jgi:hypothetical protein